MCRTTIVRAGPTIVPARAVLIIKLTQPGPYTCPTAPRLTNNMSKNIEEAQEAALTLYHAIPYVVFHQDAPAFLSSVLLRRDEWPALPSRANTAHADPALTKTAAPDPAALEDVGRGKINSNHAQPTDGQTASPSPPADQYSDVTLMGSIGENNGDSGYVNSAEKSPTSPANMPDLEGHINELEEIHEVAKGELVKIALPTVLFFRIDELEIPELGDAETDPPENHQYNGVTPPVNTQPYTLHSHLEDALVAADAPPPRPHVKYGDAALQAK